VLFRSGTQATRELALGGQARALWVIALDDVDDQSIEDGVDRGDVWGSN
jgi:hypothetical protein